MQMNYKVAGQFEHLYPVTLGDNVKLNGGLTLEAWKLQIDDLLNAVENGGYTELWSGADALKSGVTITTSEALSNSPNGWICVFKPSNSSQNYNYCYLPKTHPENGGVKFVIGGTAGSVYSKYLTIQGNSIVGHTANSDSGNDIMQLIQVLSY